MIGSSMQCEFINVTAKDGVGLQGLLFATQKFMRRPPGLSTDNVAVWVHGLTSSFHNNYFRVTTFAKVFNKEGIAFATIDTRGHDAVAFARKYDKRKKKGYRSITVGSSFEKFEDCALDLDEIVVNLKERFKNIVLMGHSTGANKVVYYLSRPRKQKNVLGAVLIGPVSDVPRIQEELGKNYEKAILLARQLVKDGKHNELMPREMVKYLRTAQRFLSLATQESIEQMFPTKDFRGPLKLFQKIKIPVLVVVGGEDQYLDLSVQEFVNCFKQNTKSKQFSSLIIEGSDHSFDGKERELAKVIAQWIKQQV